MASNPRTDDAQSADSVSQTDNDAADLVSHDGPARDGDDHDQAPDAHFGAVDGETSPIIPPMHDSEDSPNDGATNDQIDPVDEITPG